MSIVFIPEEVVSKKENKTYYMICIGLQKDGKIIRKSKAILWLSKEEYEDYTKKK